MEGPWESSTPEKGLQRSLTRCSVPSTPSGGGHAGPARATLTNCGSSVRSPTASLLRKVYREERRCWLPPGLVRHAEPWARPDPPFQETSEMVTDTVGFENTGFSPSERNTAGNYPSAIISLKQVWSSCPNLHFFQWNNPTSPHTAYCWVHIHLLLFCFFKTSLILWLLLAP